MNSESFFTDTDVSRSTVFSDFTVLPSHGYSLLVKAKRYGRWWLLKGLKEEYRNQTIYQTFLQKEYDILCQMQHPMVVSAFSYESIKEYGDCIVMEWIEGITLKQWLQSPHPLSERRKMADLLLEAVAYVHSRQTEHRDLKPSNVMVTNDGHHLKLIDFGLSDTKSYAILKEDAGTKGYMAPDGPSDIYSLGIILRELRLGWFTRPVIRRCLAPRQQRTSDVATLRKALHRCWQWPRRILAVLLAVALLAAVGAVVYHLRTKVNSLNTKVNTEASLSDSLRRVYAASHALTDSLQQHIDELDAQRQAVENQQHQREEIVRDIQHLIDQKVKSTGIEQLLDTVSSHRYIGLWIVNVEEELHRLVEQQTKTKAKSFSLSEQAVIMNALQNYIKERYTDRWGKRYAELPSF